MPIDGVGLVAVLIDGEIDLVPRREGKLSPTESAAVDIASEDEPATPEISASRLERIGALVPVFLPCGHRADVAEVVKKIRKGAVLS
jgi:hypothetical protein